MNKKYPIIVLFEVSNQNVWLLESTLCRSNWGKTVFIVNFVMLLWMEPDDLYLVARRPLGLPCLRKLSNVIMISNYRCCNCSGVWSCVGGSAGDDIHRCTDQSLEENKGLINTDTLHKFIMLTMFLLKTFKKLSNLYKESRGRTMLRWIVRQIWRGGPGRDRHRCWPGRHHRFLWIWGRGARGGGTECSRGCSLSACW